MKKMKKILIALLTFVFCLSNSRAATCESSELNKLTMMAASVRASYEVAREELEEGTYTPPDGLTDEELENYVGYEERIKVHITNITEDIYVEVKDTLSGDTKKYTYADSVDGVITITQRNTSSFNKYTIVIYSSTENCLNRKLRTIEIKTPIYNEFSSYIHCEGNEEYYLCRRYVDFELPDLDEFIEKLNKYELNKQREEEQNQEEEKGFVEFLKDNKGAVIVVTILVVVVGVGVTVVIVVRRRRVV